MARQLIWDLDGTLIDSQSEILHHLELALQDSFIKMSEQIFPIRTGPPIDIMLKESFPADILTEEKLVEVIFHFRKRYDNSDFFMTNVFDGIDEIISDTINFTHHIVTNKPNYASIKIINKLKWSDKIVSLRTPYDNIEFTKSKQELFTEIITEFGEKTSSFIGIGDMKADCLAAKENNITSVGVLWGSGTREELFDCCDYLFEETRQLYDFLYDRNRR